LTIHEVTVEALKHWAPPEAIVMVAIAGAESAYNGNGRGDRISIFNTADKAKYAAFACGEYLSFGAWQIFLGVHTQRVRDWSGLSAPCELAEWLMDVKNNATIAKIVYDNQGFRAWSTFANDAYVAFLDDATAAVSAVLAATTQLDSTLVTAVSLAPPHIHIDFADGHFEEFNLRDVSVHGPWLRFNVDRGMVDNP